MFIPIGNDFIRVRSAVVNYGLMGLNVVVHAWLMTMPVERVDSIIGQFGLVPDRLSFATSYMLVTSMFLHGDLLHLGGNVLYLWIVGNAVEDRLGHAGYLLAYLAGGFAASAVHCLATGEPGIPTIGASGAISAVMGLFVAFYPGAYIRFFFWIWAAWGFTTVRATWALALWFLLQLIDWFGSMTLGFSEIAYGAHIGGFLAGLATAVAVQRLRPPIQADGANWRIDPGSAPRSSTLPARARERTAPSTVTPGFALVALLLVLGSVAAFVPRDLLPDAAPAQEKAATGPDLVVARHAEALGRDDLETAELCWSAVVRAERPRGDFVAYVRTHRAALIGPFRKDGVLVEGTSATVAGSVEAEGIRFDVRYALVLEGSSWAIDGITISDRSPPPPDEPEPADAIPADPGPSPPDPPKADPRPAEPSSPSLSRSIETRLVGERRLEIEFGVEGFQVDQGGSCRLAVDVAFLDPDGASLVDRNEFATLERVASPDVPLRWRIAIELDRPPAAGAHELWLVVHDRVGRGKANARYAVRPTSDRGPTPR